MVGPFHNLYAFGFYYGFDLFMMRTGGIIPFQHHAGRKMDYIHPVFL